MNVIIRPALSKDFVEVHRLLKTFATFIKKPEQVIITPEQMIEDQEFFNCLVAIHQQKIIGFATYYFAYYSWTGKAIYLDDLFVLDQFRGQNIGSQLFDEVVKIGKTHNCYKMKWQVPNWNTKAQAFYKSKGALIDDVEINCDLLLNAS